ncbi:hypothetical protein EYF80_050604 [Liparis tanakae]|uniref:Uncharacterized protein n=1 Tax=Liparis tanakae TaxID=230148 RepID=A0A4Z2FEA9_9TELE|nr:hypothetical protein EYF80_050604 [Liparis tanakae]
MYRTRTLTRGPNRLGWPGCGQLFTCWGFVDWEKTKGRVPRGVGGGGEGESFGGYKGNMGNLELSTWGAQSLVLPEDPAHCVLIVAQNHRPLVSKPLLVVPHEGAVADRGA